MDPCTHKGCGAPFAPLTDPPGPGRRRGAGVRVPRKHRSRAQTPERPRRRVLPPAAKSGTSARTQVAARRDAVRAARARRREPARHRADAAGAPSGGVRHATRRRASAWRSTSTGRSRRPHTCRPTSGSRARRASRSGPGRRARRWTSSGRSRCTWSPRPPRPTPTGTRSSPTSPPTAASRSSPRARCAPRTARSIAARARPGRPYHTHIDPQPIEPGRFYDYDVEIWPTAYRLAAGHRLQLRLTSTTCPPTSRRHIRVDRDHPDQLEVEPFGPTSNTVRLGGSYLTLPVADR